MRGQDAGQHTLVGAYVMDAVPADDRASFERHLLTCEQCREEVRGLRETAARLAAAAAVPPRPELRDQTLQAAGRVRQLPPVIPDEAAGRGTPTPWGHLVGRLLWPSGRGPGPWLARAAVVVVLLITATAVGLGLHLGSMQHRLTVVQQRDHAIAAILGARDATTMTARSRTGGTATVVMSHRARALVLIASDFPRLPDAEAYEVWLMGPSGSATSAGMLPPAAHGMSGPMVVRRLAAGDRLDVTVEPASGAPRPTSPPVVLLALSR